MFGSPEVTPGGRALKFYSSVRIDLRRSESLKQGSEIIGNRVRARIVKNKVAAPFRVAEFDIMFNLGISKVGDLLDIGVSRGIVKKAGAFYSYGETRLGQGRENSKNFLLERTDISEEIEALIRGDLEPEEKTPEETAGNGHGDAGVAATDEHVADASAISLN
jgi:recombination protein RecA